jgi:hypothetical protein
LGAISDCYVEEKNYYIRVFGSYLYPHALPRFLHDTLVCRELSYQIVPGAITKEFKVTHKRVWPTVSIQVGMFLLYDFGHANLEASTLEDIKLVDIGYKRHDPHKVVENHLDQFNMKIYIHEDSPYDEIFRGVRSYDEFERRFQNLPQDQESGFLSFQKHIRNSFPKVL